MTGSRKGSAATYAEGLARGIDGAVTIATSLPGQAARSAKIFAPRVLGNDGDDMKPYYYQTPQLYKMPAHMALSDIAKPPESTAIKALPVIAAGIIGIVVYNLFVRK
jgi:hypothetical protein